MAPIGPEDAAEYLRTYANAETTRCGLAYYRSLDTDVAANAAYLSGQRLSLPILALGGGKAYGRGGETLSSLQRVGTDVGGGVIEDCGHWMPEEQPGMIADQMLRFFD